MLLETKRQCALLALQCCHLQQMRTRVATTQSGISKAPENVMVHELPNRGPKHQTEQAGARGSQGKVQKPQVQRAPLQQRAAQA